MIQTALAQSPEVINALKDVPNTFNRSAGILNTWFLAGGIALAVGVIVWGGYQMMTGAGDTEKVKIGKAAVFYGVLGLAAVVLARLIIVFVIEFLSSQ